MYDNKDGAGVDVAFKGKNSQLPHAPLFDNDDYSGPAFVHNAPRKQTFDMSEQHDCMSVACCDV